MGNFQYNINFVIDYFVMTIELEDAIKNLSQNITELKEQYNRTLTENLKLSDQVVQLTKELEEKESENQDLINSYESLKMAKTIAASSGDAHDAKIKINKLVREIDKCISLLNR